MKVKVKWEEFESLYNNWKIYPTNGVKLNEVIFEAEPVEEVNEKNEFDFVRLYHYESDEPFKTFIKKLNSEITNIYRLIREMKE